MAESEERTDPLHPRLTREIRGHDAAERTLLDAWLSGRMHHAWIVGGPSGVGKATLAYRLATFVLCNPDPAGLPVPHSSLDVEEDDPAARRVAARAHPDMLTVEPAWDPNAKRFRTEIGAAEARRVSDFLTRTAAEGGWRVCIVDPADGMNATAANALLKILEEPPARTLFLLVADVPGRLLRTIRSRCVRLDLKPLDEAAMDRTLRDLAARDPTLDMSDAAAVATLADGSPGRVVRILREGGYRRFGEFLDIVRSLPTLDRSAALELARQLAARNAATEYLRFCELLLSWLPGHIAEAVSTGEARPPEVRHPGVWAEAHDEINRTLRETGALNLDKQAAIMSVLESLARAAAEPPPMSSSTAGAS